MLEQLDKTEREELHRVLAALHWRERQAPGPDNLKQSNEPPTKEAA